MKKYLKAIIILTLYIVFTRLLFLAMIFNPSALLALTIITLEASVSGIGFLYFFDHENLFKFAKIIRIKKQKTEQKLLHKFIRFGSFGAVIIIGYITGPLLCALSTHLLLGDYRHRYYLVLLVSATSAFLAILLARGALQLAFNLL